MKTLVEEMSDHVAACFTGVWIQSHEHTDAVADMTRMCQENGWELRVWDVCNGIANGASDPTQNEATDPLSVLKAFGESTSITSPSLLVLKNFHRFLGNAEIVQTVAERIQQGKHARNFIVVLSPQTEIPFELEKLFVILEHRLPTKEQLEEIARGIATEENELPVSAELSRVLDAASGLTRYEAENAFSLSIIRDGQIKADTVQQRSSHANRDRHSRYRALHLRRNDSAPCTRSHKNSPWQSRGTDRGWQMDRRPVAGQRSNPRAIRVAFGSAGC